MLLVPVMPPAVIEPTCCPAAKADAGAFIDVRTLMWVPETASPLSARTVTTGTRPLLHGTLMWPTTVPAGSTVSGRITLGTLSASVTAASTACGINSAKDAATPRTTP